MIWASVAPKNSGEAIELTLAPASVPALAVVRRFRSIVVWRRGVGSRPENGVMTVVAIQDGTLGNAIEIGLVCCKDFGVGPSLAIPSEEDLPADFADDEIKHPRATGTGDLVARVESPKRKRVADSRAGREIHGRTTRIHACP